MPDRAGSGKGGEEAKSARGDTGIGGVEAERLSYSRPMSLEHIRSELAAVLDGAQYELSELGLYCHRDSARRGALLDAERVLAAHGPVRVFDFKHSSAGLSDNAVPHDGADIGAYEGVRSAHGSRVFRVDHHYDVPSLAAVSSTPLVIEWLRGLWRRGRSDVLGQVEQSRYVADHADTDILLSNYAASRATDAEFIHGPLPGWMSAAALRNDYITLPDGANEPYASRIFYACLGVEAAVLDGLLTFHRAQSELLSQLGPWVTDSSSRLDPQVKRRLDEWEQASRAGEAQTLGQIAAWERDGRMAWAMDGRVAILQAEAKIDNSDLYLYFLRKGRRPEVQALMFPEPGAPGMYKVKLRSHFGFDLNPLFGRLNELMPGAGFDGRAAAGGSRSVAGMDWDGFLRIVGESLDGPAA